jgi:LacI family transcriptional regulator
MLTQKEIARHLGVSISSVSLVLSGNDAGRIKPTVAREIRRVADELGYVPNHLAQSLKKGQTHTIGIVSDEVATVPFSGHLLAGAQQRAWAAGYMLLLIDVAGEESMQSPAVKSLLQRNIEALIFATAYHRELELPLVPANVPVVVLDGRPLEGSRDADSVVPDEAAGARAAVLHLAEAGHRRIGFCNVPGRYPLAGSLRLEGYRQALEESGIRYDPALVVDAPDASTADARGPAHDLLTRSDPPTAVFCFGDQIAMGFYQVAARLGLRVPDDLSIVGFDNQQFVADSLDPGLTSVQLPHTAMGEWAADRALARIAGDPSAPALHHLMPCPLIVRDSVAPPPPRHRG